MADGKKKKQNKIASRQAKGRLHQQMIRDAILKRYPQLSPRDVESTAMGQSGADIAIPSCCRSLSIFCRG